MLSFSFSRLFLLSSLLSLSSFLSHLPSSSAFDTGHHYDVTRNALLLRGFNPASDAIKTIQLQNFLTDFTALTDILPYSNYQHIHRQANLLHFNNILNNTIAIHYWRNVIINQKAGIDAIVKGIQVPINDTNVGYFNPQMTTNKQAITNKPFLLLTLLGMGTHCIEDFLAHSNWITTFQPMESLISANNASLPDTMELNPPTGTCQLPTALWDLTSNQDLGIHTYTYSSSPNSYLNDQYKFPYVPSHGGYKNGVNKDSYVKRNFDFAYATAFLEAVQLIDNFKLWIDDDTLWSQMQNFQFTSSQDRDDLNYGLHKGAEEVSSFITLPGKQEEDDGHWKGWGSGDLTQIISTATDFLTSDWQQNSVFSRAFYDTNLLDIATANLDQLSPTPDPNAVFPPPDMKLAPAPKADDFVAITIHTWGAGHSDQTPGTNDFEGLFAVIKIQDQWYREAVQYGSVVYPQWKSIKFIEKPSTPVLIEYALIAYREDASNYQTNIQPNASDTSLSHQIAESVYATQVTSQEAKKFHTTQSSVKENKKKTGAEGFRKMGLKAMKEEKAKARAELVNRVKQVRMRAEESVNRFHTLATTPTTSTPLTDDTSSAYPSSSTVPPPPSSSSSSSSFTPASNEPNIPDFVINSPLTLNFSYDASSQTIVSGLPFYYLNRKYNDPSRMLSVVPTPQPGGDLAQVNFTISTRSLCDVEYKDLRYGSLGETTVAPRYYPDGTHPTIGTDTNGPNGGGILTSGASGKKMEEMKMMMMGVMVVGMGIATALIW